MPQEYGSYFNRDVIKQANTEQPANHDEDDVQNEKLIVGLSFDCSNKLTGFYKDPKFCDIYHVCVGQMQRKTYGCAQNGERFFYDDVTKR